MLADARSSARSLALSTYTMVHSTLKQRLTALGSNLEDGSMRDGST